jgi:hypothetical protein
MIGRDARSLSTPRQGGLDVDRCLAALALAALALADYGLGEMEIVCRLAALDLASLRSRHSELLGQSLHRLLTLAHSLWGKKAQTRIYAG